MNRAAISQLFRQIFPDVDSDNLAAYYGDAGHAAGALMYGWLYWPELLELYGAIFVTPDQGGREYVTERLGVPVGDRNPEWQDLSWIEAVNSFNWFEVAHFFRSWSGADEFESELHQALGETLVSVWGARLATGYPDRQFSVTLAEPDDSVGWRIEVTQESPVLVTPERWDPRRRAIIAPEI
ncbi:hypothetical protein [Kribbella sp. CA-293567]|uniref:hypothetical protein n=1 Tax=Kribbella sp. CA-293567 TaxID=3002436 RepID=UPI0022DD4424|nr:hypothetical protein [Kribbella sp. CA-293567]WBQ07545.1 hypothetical protein OX958_12240 [Kribbella sp. CA-293567]